MACPMSRLDGGWQSTRACSWGWPKEDGEHITQYVSRCLMGSMESWCNQICFPSRTMNVSGAGLPRSVRLITATPATSGTLDKRPEAHDLDAAAPADWPKCEGVRRLSSPSSQETPTRCIVSPRPPVGLSDSPPPGAGGHSAKHPRIPGPDKIRIFWELFRDMSRGSCLSKGGT